IGKKLIITNEHDHSSPVLYSLFENNLPSILHSLTNVDFISLFNEEKHLVVITKTPLVMEIFDIQNLTNSLFNFNISDISQSQLCGIQTQSQFILLSFYNCFMLLKLQYNSQTSTYDIVEKYIVNITRIQSEEQFHYKLHLTNDNNYIIMEQDQIDSDLKSICVYMRDKSDTNLLHFSTLKYLKQKHVRAKTTTCLFQTYTVFHRKPHLLIAHHGNILRAKLPTKEQLNELLCELDIQPDNHSWMKHSLKLYQETTDKHSLSVNVTALTIQSDDSCFASGGDDGSIVVWYFNENAQEVLRNQNDKITDLKFDGLSTKCKLYSSSINRTFTVWCYNNSQWNVLHELYMHIPIEKFYIVSNNNSSQQVLIALGRFWGYDRLLMFEILSPDKLCINETNSNTNDEIKYNFQASDMTSFAL
ncbi:unnamed protein product, partial [Didymodactylos carnosus]